MISRTQVIIDWITALGWDAQQELGYPLLPGPLILDSPDQAVFITLTGGPGYTTEEPATDAWSFQARVRGPSDDPASPEVAAIQLDQLILRAGYPTSVDGLAIQHAHRLGGPPVPLLVDPEDLRHEFTSNYVIITGV